MDTHAELRTLGERVRQVRERQRLSVAELATRTGVEKQLIRKLEAGWLDPTYDVLIALACGLGIRLSVLMPQGLSSLRSPTTGAEQRLCDVSDTSVRHPADDSWLPVQ